MTRRLSHVDAKGRARMVNVGAKAVTARRALAEGRITMSREAFDLVRDNRAAKGDVLSVAELAGVAGAKRTPELIPLAHPLPLEHVVVTVRLDRKLPGVRVRAETRVEAKTGVEMEALTACAVALLAVYDMVKAADRGMEIGEIRLVEKSGGRSGPWTRKT
ncbi:MAG TPA: cyclic pyranopterin monophosphate synthase MoaC [Gemmatimonadales bacterium]|nr:cyclic pyranopterin monophosphate synthase MoaC [Gemmatimonadales bacterium]